METLIHTDQANSVVGRKITDHNHFIRDFISYALDTNTRSLVLSFDQAKAYDNVSHQYLHRILEH